MHCKFFVLSFVNFLYELDRAGVFFLYVKGQNILKMKFWSYILKVVETFYDW